jgi:hypothetical protein
VPDSKTGQRLLRVDERKYYALSGLGEFDSCTRGDALRACPWLSYSAPLALAFISRAFGAGLPIYARRLRQSQPSLARPAQELNDSNSSAAFTSLRREIDPKRRSYTTPRNYSPLPCWRNLFTGQSFFVFSLRRRPCPPPLTLTIRLLLVRELHSPPPANVERV